jgi:hypothetical protein
MSFDKLLETMGTLAKSQGVDNPDDQTVADNTDPGDGNGGDGLSADGIGTGGDGKTGKGKEKGKPMQKSFLLTMADGSEMEAFDGTDMLKALSDRLDASEQEIQEARQLGQSTEENVLKSLQAAVNLIAKQSQTLKEQGAMIKSLNDQVTALGSTGRGVRSVRSVTDIRSNDLNKSLNGGAQDKQLTGSEILAKSLNAMTAGRISGYDAARIETAINLGIPVAPELMTAISA